MTINQVQEYVLRLRGLALFRRLLQDEVICLFTELLSNMQKQNSAQQVEKNISLYGEFVAALYENGGNFGTYLHEKVMHCENAAVRLRAKGMQPPAEMSASLMRELDLFTQLASVEPQKLSKLINSPVELPQWQNSICDFKGEYSGYLANANKRGYGVFAEHHMFVLNNVGQIKPVLCPDVQSLAQLTGYEREREQVLVNTKALMQGLAASNVLLYGDAGTGKSSTVKAIANEYKSVGLRLVEVRKTQLGHLAQLMETLAENPLKFILFIDDLSFKDGAGDFTELKAILEGNVAARPSNVVVYATSNRRHLLHESFSSRAGDELHLADTMEEETSLSERFGLTITFQRPDKYQYKEIIFKLAKENGVQMPEDELLQKAEAHALRAGGRSPRVAKQFAQILSVQQQTK